MIVLNVGAGFSRALPPFYTGWEQRVLDIDEASQPDLLMDARNLIAWEGGLFDAVYCAHNIEHFYGHEVPGLLRGFHRVLKDHGRVEIEVPNMQALALAWAKAGGDIDAVWYVTHEGYPVRFHEALYGWAPALAQGSYQYTHKFGFTPDSLRRALADAGFVGGYDQWDDHNIISISFKGDA